MSLKSHRQNIRIITPLVLRSRQGVTLVELVMVVVMAGILAVMAVPRLDVYYEIKLQNAAKKVVADIRYSQNKAMSRHADTRLVFDNGNEIYRAEYCDVSCGSSANWHALRDPATGSALIVNYATDSPFTGVDITTVDFAGTNTLRFNWQGTPLASGGTVLIFPGTVSLTLRGSSVTMTVEPQTGKIEVQ